MCADWHGGVCRRKVMVDMELQDSNPEVSAQIVTIFSLLQKYSQPYSSNTKGGVAPAPPSFYTRTHTHSFCAFP